MLNVYAPVQSDAEKYTKILKRQTDTARLQNFKISAHIEPEHQRQKLIISPHWDQHALNSLRHSESGRFVENTIHDVEKYIEKSTEETTDLYLVLTTKTLYEQDVVTMLIEFLKARQYADGLIEVFATVLKELITNAVIHGSLELDLYLADILDPTDFTPEKAELLQETFMKIQGMLNDPTYGQKPITLRITCFDEAIIIDIQDQGPGFDFEAFQQKYHDTKFVKGMDLVFLMSKDIQYDPNTKTISAILENPDKKPSPEIDIHSDKICLGINTDDTKKFKTMKSLLSGAGFQNIKCLPPEKTKWHEISKSINLLIILSDIPPERMVKTVEELRKYTSQIDLPILCQKAETLPEDFVQKLKTKNVNDVFSSDILQQELLSRVKAHLSMTQAQNNFFNFYSHYQSEIIQSEKTIEHFEKISPKSLRGNNNQKKFWMLVNGAQTVVESTENIELLPEKSKIPYGNGFSVSRGDQDYGVFISMCNGLSSVLIMSYLKGYIECLKEGKNQLSPASIIEKVQSFAAEILPVSVTLNIFCTCWDKNRHEFEFAQKGAFTAIQYDTTTNKLRTLNRTKESTHTLNQNQSLYIFDATIPIDHAQLRTLSKHITTGNAQDSSFIKTADINLYSAHNIKIPYLLILPYKEQEKTK